MKRRRGGEETRVRRGSEENQNPTKHVGKKPLGLRYSTFLAPLGALWKPSGAVLGPPGALGTQHPRTGRRSSRIRFRC
eukprot:2049916-Pyramimonas_sp.AAC.1